MINITINQKEYTFSSNLSLEKVINELAIDTKGVAVAINNSIVQKENWAKTQIQNNDNILIIKATQGG